MSRRLPWLIGCKNWQRTHRDTHTRTHTWLDMLCCWTLVHCLWRGLPCLAVIKMMMSERAKTIDKQRLVHFAAAFLFRFLFFYIFFSIFFLCPPVWDKCENSTKLNFSLDHFTRGQLSREGGTSARHNTIGKSRLLLVAEKRSQSTWPALGPYPEGGLERVHSGNKFMTFIRTSD